jgi:CheY-like chemotaxis protein
VVADEIRKLAESSGQQSKTTAGMLKKIKASIDSITISSNDVLSRFEVIDTGVKTVSQLEQNVRNAMEEQEIGGQQILNSVSRLKELNASVKNGSGGMRESGDLMIRQTNDFIKISKDSVNGMNDIVNGAMSEIKTAVVLVDEMSAENTRNFDELKMESEKFKVDTGNEKKIVLIVDDDETHLKLAESALHDEYDVVTVKSGKDALSLFYKGLVPHLILLDIIMPGMGGWDTYERIRSIGELHDTSMAFCSSSDDEKDIQKARKLGAADYIMKPIRKADLLDKVGKILKK